MVKDRMHPPSESTSQFIRAHLSEKGKDYTYGMYKAWCAHLERLGMKTPKWDSFRRYFWVLVKLGLVRKTTALQHQSKSPIRRVYYELVPKNVNANKIWANPQVALYGEKMKLGRRRYRRQVLKVPALQRGRPKGTDSYDRAV